jgi:hypothetical protein
VAGQDDPWFTVPPKGNGDVKDGEANIKVLTDTATADATSKATWKWHDDSVNIYLNNGSSGRCCGSFLNTIFIGGSAYDELLIHELGHFLSLQHTHGNFNEDGDLDDWNDGDGFSQTLADDPDATAADIAAQYPGASQATVDALSRNIMSYHQDENDLDRFVWQQREAMIETFNIDKSYAASGKARIVNSDGDDSADGLTVDNRLETLQKAVDLSTSPNDVALVGGSVHDVANGMVISTPITLLPWRSPVIIK